MSCGYSEIIGISRFKCSRGMLKEFPTIHHLHVKNGPPLFGRIVGKCPVCGGGSSVVVGFVCLEVTSTELLGALYA